MRPVLQINTVIRKPGFVVENYPVRHLRRDVVDTFTQTPVIHRLMISTVGRPLWEYSSDVELLKGMRAALEG